MKQRPRIFYTEEQKALMWNRWQKGASLNAIIRHLTARPPKIKTFKPSGGANCLY